MAALPWMPLYVADYLADTRHLSAAEHGAYLLLLMQYWHDGPLPNDPEKLQKICRASSEEENRAVLTVLKEFFRLKNSRFHNRRADKEITEAKRIRRVKALAGKAGGIAARGKSGRKPNSKTIADELQNNTQSQSPKQSQIHIEEVRKEVRAEVSLPIWLPLDAWSSFLKTRKRMTPRASELLISALTRLREDGDDPQSVLEQSVMNGWTGLFPLKKVNGNGRGNGSQQQGRGIGIAAADAIGKIRRASEIHPGRGDSSTGGKCEVLASDPSSGAPVKARSGNGRGNHRGTDDSGCDLSVPDLYDRGEEPAVSRILQRSRPLPDRTD